MRYGRLHGLVSRYSDYIRPSLLTCASRHQSAVFRPSRRAFINDVPNILLPPLVFSGLLVTLWTWKCLMMILFQNKIIYMPGLPPNARHEKIIHYANQYGDISWREERTKARDGIDIALCIASVDNTTFIRSTIASIPHLVYILYFQG
jgi:hypothetical protein